MTFVRLGSYIAAVLCGLFLGTLFNIPLWFLSWAAAAGVFMGMVALAFALAADILLAVREGREG